MAPWIRKSATWLSVGLMLTSPAISGCGGTPEMPGPSENQNRRTVAQTIAYIDPTNEVAIPPELQTLFEQSAHDNRVITLTQFGVMTSNVLRLQGSPVSGSQLADILNQEVYTTGVGPAAAFAVNLKELNGGNTFTPDSELRLVDCFYLAVCLGATAEYYNPNARMSNALRWAFVGAAGLVLVMSALPVSATVGAICLVSAGVYMGAPLVDYAMEWCDRAGALLPATGNSYAGVVRSVSARTDSDSDDVPDVQDGCPNDPNKTLPGVCGCGVPDTDSDRDGTPDCRDGCPNDPNKTSPGACGCGVPDTDSDGDATSDCRDGCPSDPNKTSPGNCGCGKPETPGCGDQQAGVTINDQGNNTISIADTDGNGAHDVTFTATVTGGKTVIDSEWDLDGNWFHVGMWYAQETAYDVSVGTHTARVWVRFQDNTEAQDTVTLIVSSGGAAPSVSSFSINNGASSTTSTGVTLNNSCTGSPTHYMASESSSFSGASWQTYSTSSSFTLSSGDGTKTVYFKVKNAAGESPSASDSIALAAGGGDCGGSAVLWSGNGHYYECVDEGVTWAEAKAAAESKSCGGLHGHLATITSQAENDFVTQSVLSGGQVVMYWLGGYQPAGSPEPGGNWRWVTGETWSFANWNTGEPSNAGGGEDSVEIYSSGSVVGKWNDMRGSAPNETTGYVVEYEP